MLPSGTSLRRQEEDCVQPPGRRRAHVVAAPAVSLALAREVDRPREEGKGRGRTRGPGAPFRESRGAGAARVTTLREEAFRSPVVGSLRKMTSWFSRKTPESPIFAIR